MPSPISLRFINLSCLCSAVSVMHSSYTNRKGVEKLLRMINTPSAIQLSKNLSRLLSSISSQVSLHNLQPLYSKSVNVHITATPPKCLSPPSSPTLLVLESSLYRAKMLLIDCMWRAVELNYKHTGSCRYAWSVCCNSLVWGSLRLATINETVSN